MGYSLDAYLAPLESQRQSFQGLASDARRSLSLTSSQLKTTLAQNQAAAQQLQASYRPAEDTSGANIQYLESILLQERQQYRESLALMNERVNSLNDLALEQSRMAEAMTSARIPTPERSAAVGIFGDLRMETRDRPVLSDLVTIDPSARYL